MNKFKNTNATSFLKFIFLKNDELPYVAVCFISRLNSTSARKFPILEFSRKTRIVYIYGLPIPKTDFIIIKFVEFALKIIQNKLSKYDLIWIMFKKDRLIKTNQIIDLDDPTYTVEEILDLKLWQSNLKVLGKKGLILVTNKHTINWLKTNGIENNLILIPQGHWTSKFPKKRFVIGKKIKLAYVSPYIDTKGDKHFGHESWDATHLIENIWPILNRENCYELHLFGRLGQNALEKLEGTNFVNHGLLDQNECATEMSKCDIGLYPRKKDSMRQVQKVIAYLGAGLPIITYKTIDTSIVAEQEIGITVESENEFISAVKKVSNDKNVYIKYLSKLEQLHENFYWGNLALELEDSIDSCLNIKN